VFIEAKDDGGGGDNLTTGAISRAKLQSNHHHQQTNIQFFTKHWRETCIGNLWNIMRKFNTERKNHDLDAKWRRLLRLTADGRRELFECRLSRPAPTNYTNCYRYQCSLINVMSESHRVHFFISTSVHCLNIEVFERIYWCEICAISNVFTCLETAVSVLYIFVAIRRSLANGGLQPAHARFWDKSFRLSGNL